MLLSLIIVDIILVITTVLSYSHLPPQVPLFYTRPWGEDQLGDLWLIAILPLFVHIFFFFNIWLSKKYVVQDSFVDKLLRGCNWFLVFALLGIFLKIILLVI